MLSQKTRIQQDFLTSPLESSKMIQTWRHFVSPESVETKVTLLGRMDLLVLSHNSGIKQNCGHLLLHAPSSCWMTNLLIKALTIEAPWYSNVSNATTTFLWTMNAMVRHQLMFESQPRHHHQMKVGYNCRRIWNHTILHVTKYLMTHFSVSYIHTTIDK